MGIKFPVTMGKQWIWIEGTEAQYEEMLLRLIWENFSEYENFNEIGKDSSVTVGFKKRYGSI